jgi:hypothetical protein
MVIRSWFAQPFFLFSLSFSFLRMADGEGAQKDGREEDQAVKLCCGGKVMFVEYRCSCAILVPNVCVCACVCVVCGWFVCVPRECVYLSTTMRLNSH